MKRIFIILFLWPVFLGAQTVELIKLTGGRQTSIRGMSIVSDLEAWVSGSNGYIGKTLDGGKTWHWMQPRGYESLDFRDIEAFSGERAIVVNAGSPAFVLNTTNGGVSWTENYNNRDTAVFLDGMSFWDKKNGIIFGDPIHKHLHLLRSSDGGMSWKDISENLKKLPEPGEAGFAASGSTIRTQRNGKVWIATGGTSSNIYHSDNFGNTWDVWPCPIWQGESSTGVFSMDFADSEHGVVVGGDYLKDKENKNNVLLTHDGGRTWLKPVKPVFGYRSGVVYAARNIVIATGSSGTDVSLDGGMNWKNVSDIGFNVVQKSKLGSLILLAGADGKIYRLNIKR